MEKELVSAVNAEVVELMYTEDTMGCYKHEWATAIVEATSGNPKLCVTLHRRNAHLPLVNSAFVSIASLDFRVSGGCLERFFNAMLNLPRYSNVDNTAG